MTPKRDLGVPRELLLDGLSPADLPLVTERFSIMERTMGDKMAGMIRHVLTSVGGLLVMMGYTDEVTMATVVGAAMTIIGFAWSWMAK